MKLDAIYQIKAILPRLVCVIDAKCMLYQQLYWMHTIITRSRMHLMDAGNVYNGSPFSALCMNARNWHHRPRGLGYSAHIHIQLYSNFQPHSIAQCCNGGIDKITHTSQYHCVRSNYEHSHNLHFEVWRFKEKRASLTLQYPSSLLVQKHQTSTWASFSSGLTASSPQIHTAILHIKWI